MRVISYRSIFASRHKLARRRSLRLDGICEADCAPFTEISRLALGATRRGGEVLRFFSSA
jgi:hypothetical protein